MDIGNLGLGAMGTAMAQSLAAAGHRVRPVPQAIHARRRGQDRSATAGCTVDDRRQAP